MINVTQSAQEMVQAYFEDKPTQPIRIFISSGCGGQQLAMALDEKAATDSVFTHDGIEYIMETTLMAQATPVEVDYAGTGFKINSQLELGGGCSSCGTNGSCCS